MSVLIALAALALLMLAAYRGYSVILFAPIAALGAGGERPASRVPQLGSLFFFFLFLFFLTLS